MFGLTSNPSWLYNGSPKLTCFLWLAIVVVVMSFVDGLHAEKYIIHQVYVGQYFQYDLLQNMAWYNRPMVIQIKVILFRLVLFESTKVIVRFTLSFIILERCLYWDCHIDFTVQQVRNSWLCDSFAAIGN